LLFISPKSNGFAFPFTILSTHFLTSSPRFNDFAKSFEVPVGNIATSGNSISSLYSWLKLLLNVPSPPDKINISYFSFLRIFVSSLYSLLIL